MDEDAEENSQNMEDCVVAQHLVEGDVKVEENAQVLDDDIMQSDDKFISDGILRPKDEHIG